MEHENANHWDLEVGNDKLLKLAEKLCAENKQNIDMIVFCKEVKDEKSIYVIEIRCNDGLKKVFDLFSKVQNRQIYCKKLFP